MECNFIIEECVTVVLLLHRINYDDFELFFYFFLFIGYLMEVITNNLKTDKIIALHFKT